MKTVPIIVTIDGPAASGKTSVSRNVASRRGWSWVSTGAFYRGLAYIATRLGISLEDEEALAKLCVENFWRVKMSHDRTQVFYKNEDCTDEIYKENNGNAASAVSKFPKVRERLLEAQRNCAKGVPGLIAEGRDCGTVVFPSAHVKIYLTAGSANRAERRAREEGRNVEEMKIAQSKRDQQDSSRTAAPMQAASDAQEVDTTQMSLDEVVSSVEKIIDSKLATIS